MTNNLELEIDEEIRGMDRIGSKLVNISWLTSFMHFTLLIYIALIMPC